MNTTSHGNPAPDGDSASTQPLSFPVKLTLFLIGLFVFVLTAYSIYVDVHEPDPQETIILGQRTIAAASPAALRIVVRHRVSHATVQGAKIALTLTGKSSGPINLGTFRTAADGSISDPVNIPDLAPGEYELKVDVTSPLGRDHVVKKMEVQHPMRVLLSSDKPLYQPGQTIHLRSLVSNARTQKPFTNAPVVFEVTDPKGNKVFKETRQLSAFGIASADFVLATELNLGRYQMRALAGPAVTERTIEVKRYVLPKFKINIVTEQSYYLPGQTVSGSVQAAYFFGKPVGDAAIKLVTSAPKVPEIHGRTDASGNFSFHFVLPDYFVGLPQNTENAWLDLTAEVTDSGEHVEQKMRTLSVAQNELELTAIPEAGVLVPGVENLVYLLTTYPDGRPAVCRVFADGTPYQSDAQGISIIKLSPTDAGHQLELEARDDSGKKARLTFKPGDNDSAPPLLVRADKAVYQAGDIAQLTLLSPMGNNTAFIDVIKDGQTVLTKSVPLNNHQARYSLALPASLVGTLQINAYLITESGEDRGLSRLIYVNPASALQIKTQMDKLVYRPGEMAKIQFNVLDAHGQPAPAALGISAVDESVFALSENRPGLLQQFLDVEADLMKPRYQIKSFADPGMFLGGAGGNQALAQAYFSSWSKTPALSQADDPVRNDYMSPKILERIRSMRGTPEYESLRKDARYAALMRQVEEGDRGLYTLREATGEVKLRATESHRRAYFNSLKKYLLLAFCGSIFLLPIGLIIYYLSPLAIKRLGTFANVQHARYVAAAASTYHVLAALTLCPLIFYPLGFALFEGARIDEEHGAYLLLAFEAVVVLLSLLLQWRSNARAKTESLGEEIVGLQSGLAMFFLQFSISRIAFVILLLDLISRAEYFGPLLFFGSLLAPLVVLGVEGSYIRRQFLTRDIPNKIGRVTVVDILVIISLLFILAGLLLPALAKAKQKATRISLMNDLKQVELANQFSKDDDASTGSPAAPRVRRDFPETLLWRPELITDDQGKATLEIPLADSITTWRASVDAVNLSGKMGSTELPIAVFQDFFVDLDLPVSMSLNDEVSLPVTCYNYLKTPQNIRLQLAPAGWFECVQPSATVSLAPNEVKSLRFPIKVRQVGNHSLHVTAQGPKTADAIEREILVTPVGRKIEYTKNDSLKTGFKDSFSIPADAIPGSESLWLKFYPSRFSEVVEGLDSIFKAPYGCFEQTSSTTYPNVLVLDYMKRMGRLTPEIEIKARKYINAGYQRLLTFEVAGGGFEWFGRDPANICLTAYGILEFTDMARVHPVDEAVIARAHKWLFAQQNANGSWDEIHRGWTWSGRGSMTAFAAWCLAESGDQSANLDRALDYLRSHKNELANTYAKALAANAFLARDPNDSFGRDQAKQLKDSAIVDNGQTIHWTSAGYSITYSHESGMDAEVTALATMALMKAGQWPQSVKQGLTWISTHKFADGTLGTTQATILAMRALLAGSSASLPQKFESTITLLLNGEPVGTVRINQDNSDVMQQIDLAKHLHAGENHLELRQVPAGELPFQLTGAYWLPGRDNVAGGLTGPPATSEPLQIDLQYDHTSLAVNDLLLCTVTVRNNTDTRINMAMVDLGIPPGFDVDASAFEAMQRNDQIAKFEITGNQVILYLRELAEHAPLRFNYPLRAKYPLRVKTPPSAVYEYYQPANRAETKPVSLQVRND